MALLPIGALAAIASVRAALLSLRRLVRLAAFAPKTASKAVCKSLAIFPKFSGDSIGGGKSAGGLFILASSCWTKGLRISINSSVTGLLKKSVFLVKFKKYKCNLFDSFGTGW